MKATKNTPDKAQPVINLQSFYDFAKLNTTEQTIVLTKEGTLLDLDKEEATTTKLYLLKGFFVEETSCSKNNEITDIIPFKGGYRVITYLEVKKNPEINNSGITSYSMALVKRIAAICIVLFSVTGLFSQKNTTIGTGVDYYSSGNGHGAFYSPHLIVDRSNDAFSIGPVIQKRSGIMNGLKVAYTRNLTGNVNKNTQSLYHRDMPDLLQFNAFGSMQYNNRLPFSYSEVKNEQAIRRENLLDASMVQFSTLEATVGFGAQVNITRSLSWKSYVGASFYCHPDLAKGFDRQRTGNSITLGTGITFLMF